MTDETPHPTDYMTPEEYEAYRNENPLHFLRLKQWSGPTCRGCGAILFADENTRGPGFCSRTCRRNYNRLARGK